MAELCPVCNLELVNPETSGSNSVQFECPRCGKFSLTGSLISTLPYTLSSTANADAKISHAIQTMQRDKNGAELNTFTIDEILKRSLPSPREQVDIFIRWLAENTEGPGKTIEILSHTHQSIIGATSEDGFALILSHLLDTGILIGQRYGGGNAEVGLSFEGWDRYEDLLSGIASYRRAFMAMKFGDNELDRVLENVFKPCVVQTGFELLRLDDVPKAGLIDDRLRVEIQTSDFIIADLTHDNLGAYWEAGYAEGLGKPVIYTCEKEKFESASTHFDTNHHLTIIWDKNNPQGAGENLKATIRATLPELANQKDE